MSFLGSQTFRTPESSYFLLTNDNGVTQSQNVVNTIYLSTGHTNVNLDTNISTIQGGVYSVSYDIDLYGNSNAIANNSYIYTSLYPKSSSPSFTNSINGTLYSGAVNLTSGSYVKQTVSGVVVADTTDTLRILNSLINPSNASTIYTLVVQGVNAVKLN